MTDISLFARSLRSPLRFYRIYVPAANISAISSQPKIMATSPPNTPLLASASKKQLDRRERRGDTIQETTSVVKEIFEAEESSVDTPVKSLASLKPVAQKEWEKVRAC